MPCGEKRTVFGEAQRLKANLDIASCKEGRELAGKELLVRPCDVDVKVLERIDSIHQAFKIWHELNFVEKNIGLLGRIDLCFDELPCCSPSREVGKQWALEIDGYDLFFGNALGAQFILEELEKRRFAATADSRDDFDDIFVAPLGEPVGEHWASDFFDMHIRNLPFREKFSSMIAKLLTLVNR